MGREMRDAGKAVLQGRKKDRPTTKKYTKNPMHSEPYPENDSNPSGFGIGPAIIAAKVEKMRQHPIVPREPAATGPTFPARHQAEIRSLPNGFRSGVTLNARAAWLRSLSLSRLSR